jgi:hypothetical protein
VSLLLPPTRPSSILNEFANIEADDLSGKRTALHDFATMQLLDYPHFPKQLSRAHIALFTKVSNATSLRARIIAASTMEGPQGDAEREAVNFAFVEAKLVSKSVAATRR